MASVLSSLRYLLADIIGEDDDPLPPLPENFPAGAKAAVGEGIRLLIDYQGPSYAQLYVDRLKRFVGRAGVDAAMFSDIARLMAMRMSYEDPIRIAQLKLGRERATAPSARSDRRKFRIDELIGALPAVAAEPVLDVLEWVGWTHAPVSIRFSAASRWGDSPPENRGGAEAMAAVFGALRQGTDMGRTLAAHDRPQPDQAAASGFCDHSDGDHDQGYGSVYRHGLADWHAIIDGLVKPTFDGVLPLSDLAGAIAEARAAMMPDPRQVALKRKIAEIRARALGAGANVATC